MRVILQLVLDDIMRAMFASLITRLKIGEAMNTGKIILVDASKAKLGDDGCELYQRFFLALILGAAQARSILKPSQKLPVYCCIDECQWVRNDQKLATILDECRSQKISLTRCPTAQSASTTVMTRLKFEGREDGVSLDPVSTSNSWNDRALKLSSWAPALSI